MWQAFFEQHGVQRKAIPFGLTRMFLLRAMLDFTRRFCVTGLPAIEQGTIEDFQHCRSELGDFVFPEDYKTFSLEIGPGTFVTDNHTVR